jgi:hypothetical protein
MHAGRIKETWRGVGYVALEKLFRKAIQLLSS